MIFVGESVQFPSKDERTTGRKHIDFLNEDNFPDVKPAPGWWPCKDFPEWVNLIKELKPDIILFSIPQQYINMLHLNPTLLNHIINIEQMFE